MPPVYTIDATGGIVITSEREVIQRHLVTRWYDLRDLLPEGLKEFTFSNGPTVFLPFAVADGPPHLPHHLWEQLYPIGRAVDPAWKVASGWDLSLAAPVRDGQGIVRLTGTRLHHVRFSHLLAQFRAPDRQGQPPPPADVPPAGAEAPQPARRPLRDGWTVEAVQRHLNRKLSEVNLDAVPLSDALEFLADVSGFPMEGNWGALQAVGVAKDTPVSLRRKGVPLRETIELVLKAAQAKTKTPLHYWVDTDRWALVITTFDDYVASNTVTRSYDLGTAMSLARPPKGGANPVEAMAALIVKSVAPGTWEGAGTKPGAVRRGPASELVVTHLREHHPQVEALVGRVIEHGFPG